jgi:O-antigen ligase
MQTKIWDFLLLVVFALALAGGGYCGWRLHESQPSLPANFLAAEKEYGVNIDLTRYDAPGLAERLAELHAAGLVWLRQPANWADLEPAPGQFTWEAFDRIVAAVAQENRQAGVPLKLIVVLQTSPAWARPADTSSPMTPPAELRHWGDFVYAFAARYGEQLDYYQIWHEPNLSANWGNTFVSTTAYGDLLREAALNLRAADPEAIILSAALAATLEEGPLNLNEVIYLDRLYQAKAAPWFDVVGAEAYGLGFPPDHPPQADLLNFRRVELLRRVMLAHGDADTPVWAVAFGWNALPPDWSGQPSPWSYDTAPLQATRTAEAITQARQHWPWLGPMLAVCWDKTGLAADDPLQGFSLQDTPPVYEAFRAAARSTTVATPGHYPATHPSGQYSPGWRFALSRADPPHNTPRTLTIPFEGTRLDLGINPGPYRGQLWVTVDGGPANALPQDDQGRSYALLYDPLRKSRLVTLARHMPFGPHRAVIEAEGGWGQWPIGGWTVAAEPDIRPWQNGLWAAVGLALVSGLGWLWRGPASSVRLLLAWSGRLITFYTTLGERAQVALTFTLAVAFYVAPGWFGVALLLPTILLILLRPDLGLVLVAFSLSFFQSPKQLPFAAFSPVELLLALSTAGFILRALFSYLSAPTSRWGVWIAHPADRPILALVLLALAATLAAENFGASLYEWRVIIFEAALFYFLVRSGPDTPPDGAHWAWRLGDGFVAGAVLQASISLYFYFWVGRAIEAEGVRRALALSDGSPNNLALFLDRAWPILLAAAIFSGRGGAKQWLYRAGLVVVSVALYLTFSKGALLVGMPVSVLVMGLLYARRQGRGRVAVMLAVIALALVPLSQTERFRSMLDFSQGSTTFFRLKLWQAALTMWSDHWWLGVGLDNFLYQYRTHYMLPEAWQEPNLSHPHNLLLDFGTRLGVGGVLILLWLQLLFWRSAWRLYQRQPQPLILGLIGSMAVFLSHGAVDNSYFLVDLAFIFSLTLGVMVGLERQ